MQWNILGAFDITVADVAEGRARFLLPEGRWFDSLGVHVEVFLGLIVNRKKTKNVTKM